MIIKRTWELWRLDRRGLSLGDIVKIDDIFYKVVRTAEFMEEGDVHMEELILEPTDSQVVNG
jgi:hypothetical protein